MRAARLLLRRLKLGVLVAVLLMGLMAAGAFFPLGDEEGLELQRRLESLDESGLELGIFSNNVLVALLGAIPFAGPPLAGYIVFNTGRFLGWLSAQLGLPAGLMLAIMLPLTILTGYGLLEFLGYGLAVAESLTLSYYMARRRELLRRELRMLPLALGVSALFLALGAVLEAALIRFLPAILGGPGI